MEPKTQWFKILWKISYFISTLFTFLWFQKLLEGKRKLRILRDQNLPACNKTISVFCRFAIYISSQFALHFLLATLKITSFSPICVFPKSLLFPNPILSRKWVGLLLCCISLLFRSKKGLHLVLGGVAKCCTRNKY